MRDPKEMAQLLRERLTQAEFLDLLDCLDEAGNAVLLRANEIAARECPHLFATDEDFDLTEDSTAMKAAKPSIEWENLG